MQFIAFEVDRQHLNDFTATNQYRVQGVKQCRDDTVLLVNGIPARDRRIQEPRDQRLRLA